MSSDDTLDKYNTWIEEDDYNKSSTVGVTVSYRGGAKILFGIDKTRPGSDRTVSIIKKYTELTQSEANSLRNSAESNKTEEANKIARRMIRQATGAQSEEERDSHPIRAYVTSKVGGQTIFVDVSEDP